MMSFILLCFILSFLGLWIGWMFGYRDAVKSILLRVNNPQYINGNFYYLITESDYCELVHFKYEGGNNAKGN